MIFGPCKSRVSNRGEPPDSFLTELVEWGREESEEVFAPNPNPADVYAYMRPILGPWGNLLHRRAALLEEIRVHAGLESSWNFGEGKDPGNHSPDPKTWEAGVLQVSFDSTEIDHGAMLPFAVEYGIGTVGSFRDQMKSNHPLALEYYARLARINVRWAGPLLRHEVDPWLSRAAVSQFQELLA